MKTMLKFFTILSILLVSSCGQPTTTEEVVVSDSDSVAIPGNVDTILNDSVNGEAK